MAQKKGKDYYAILGLKRDATASEIKRAYHQAALNSHPDKVQGDDKVKEAAAEVFKNVGEAYDVLRDPEKKKIYDTYGEAGLKGFTEGGGPPPGAAGGGGMPGGMPPGGMPGGGTYTFSQQDASKIFEQFFGSSSPFAGGGPGGGAGFTRHYRTGGGGGPRGMSFGGGGGGNPFAAMFGMGGGGDDDDDGSSASAGKPPSSEFTFYCSLEEIATGCVKKFNVDRVVKPGSAPEKKLFEVKVEPGYKSGTKVRYENDGGYVDGYSKPCDMVFILEEKPHPRFKRDGSNLIHKRNLTLREALLGTQVQVQGLDGKPVTIPVTGVTSPGRIIRVGGAGLYDRKTKKAGDLLLELGVVMPSSLTDQQRKLVEQMQLQ